eukprot:m.218873 g.218873  ORF g.218873 m.218873 type:complete len:302 (-) comp30104_c0_seq1:163-1068(-)
MRRCTMAVPRGWQMRGVQVCRKSAWCSISRHHRPLTLATDSTHVCGSRSVSSRSWRAEYPRCSLPHAAVASRRMEGIRLAPFNAQLHVEVRQCLHRSSGMHTKDSPTSSQDNTQTPTFPQEDFIYIPNAVTEDEAALLLKEFEAKLKRKRYEQGHWDGAIVDYREFENRDWRNPDCQHIVSGLQQRIEVAVGKGPIPFLPRVHVIDLSDKGVINPHVDSVKFSGGLVAGLSLLCDAIMRFRPADTETGLPLPDHAPSDFVLAQNSLYVMKGKVRYNYTHEVLPRQGDGRRISMMMRNEWQE